MTVFVSDCKNNSNQNMVYHTTRECPHFPHSVREEEDTDGLRECPFCINVELSGLEL